MTAAPKSKGPWINRFAIRSLTLVLGLLTFWLLGFFVQDIRAIRGPDYDEIEKRHVDQALLDQQTDLKKQIKRLDREIESEKETQRLVGDSTRNLQQTINQLLELQKLSIEKAVERSEGEREEFSDSLAVFLENQEKYQELNRTITGLVGERRELETQLRVVEQTLKKQRKPAREEYNDARQRHRLKLAFIQLAILVPLLAIAVALIFRKRGSIYFPFFLAFGVATLLKVALVIHEYFPKRYFKYILILALLIGVGRLLVYFIRMIAFPKAHWLIKQYREAYERFLCPVCEYPIRTGPRRFLFWTRRTVNKAVLPSAKAAEEEAYTCPACGTALFEACDACGKIRHALLPNCRHCGGEKAVAEGS